MKDCVGKIIKDKEGKETKEVFLFAFYSTLNKHSIIKFYRYNHN